jgi:hypothetical protein
MLGLPLVVSVDASMLRIEVDDEQLRLRAVDTNVYAVACKPLVY